MTCTYCGGHALYAIIEYSRHGERTVYECDDCGHEQPK